MTEDEKQKYFEEGYDQCYREVIAEIKSWNHPDTKSFLMWLNKVFESSAKTLVKALSPASFADGCACAARNGSPDGTTSTQRKPAI